MRLLAKIRNSNRQGNDMSSGFPQSGSNRPMSNLLFASTNLRSPSTRSYFPQHYCALSLIFLFLDRSAPGQGVRRHTPGNIPVPVDFVHHSATGSHPSHFRNRPAIFRALEINLVFGESFLPSANFSIVMLRLYMAYDHVGIERLFLMQCLLCFP